jgi:homospermidine synthase
VLSLHELAGGNWRMQQRQRLLRDEIESGIDELGVLLMGHARGAYWYGSRLSIGEARSLAPANSATTLQVAAGIVGAMVWMLRHPREGLVEPDEIDFAQVLAVARPWLGPIEGAYTDWTPLADRAWLFDEPLDLSDPWQFINFRVD